MSYLWELEGIIMIQRRFILLYVLLLNQNLKSNLQQTGQLVLNKNIEAIFSRLALKQIIMYVSPISPLLSIRDDNM